MDNKYKAAIGLFVLCGFLVLQGVEVTWIAVVFAFCGLLIGLGTFMWDHFKYESPHLNTGEQHWSFNPTVVHRVGDWVIAALGGFVCGEWAWKCGEGTLVVPKSLWRERGFDIDVDVRVATRCDLSELPLETQDFISSVDYFKEPYYFSIVPIDLPPKEQAKYSALDNKFKQVDALAKFYKGQAKGRYEGVEEAMDSVSHMKHSWERKPLLSRFRGEKEETPKER